MINRKTSQPVRQPAAFAMESLEKRQLLSASSASSILEPYLLPIRQAPKVVQQAIWANAPRHFYIPYNDNLYVTPQSPGGPDYAVNLTYAGTNIRMTVDPKGDVVSSTMTIRLSAAPKTVQDHMEDWAHDEHLDLPAHSDITEYVGKFGVNSYGTVLYSYDGGVDLRKAFTIYANGNRILSSDTIG